MDIIDMEVGQEGEYKALMWPAKEPPSSLDD